VTESISKSTKTVSEDEEAVSDNWGM